MDYDVLVIGAGPGGYVAAIRCAQNGLKTACIDKRAELGGTCLNVGCIPSKALLHASEFYHKMASDAAKLGINAQGVTYDFDKMMQRKNEIVSGFNQGIAGLFKKNKITFITGTAAFSGPNSVSVDGKEISAKHIIIATGSEPTELPFAPFDETKIISSTGALALKSVPKKLIVVGAGVIGVELGSVYARLGSEVHFIEFLDRICPALDLTIGKAFQKILEQQNLSFTLSAKLTAAKIEGEQVHLTYETKEGVQNETCDAALICVGRRPYTRDLNLDKVGISLDDKGRIAIDGSFRTSQSHIYAIGDVIDGPMLAHKASEEGVAVADLICGKKSHLNYIAIPNVIYTYPEVASVGLSEEEAKKMGLQVKTGSFPLKANSRARCSDDTEGMVKIISEATTGRLIGIHILGAHAGELIQEGALALEKHATASDLAATPHAHPTLSEALKEAAMAIAQSPIHM
ncbi:MAG: dihydrolipoyl dehydrogenase [Chlamydiales bacterium]|nr:dihydrolipoyl dehydrogenase [Chlamydiales bacterium]